MYQRSLLVITFLAFAKLPAPVSGSGRLSVTMLRYDNPEGKVSGGKCCNGADRNRCPDNDCDHQFEMCLDKSWGPMSMSSCMFGSITTGVVRGPDVVVFGEDIGGKANPLAFTFPKWTGRALLKVKVWEARKNRPRRKIDFFTLRFMQGVAGSPVRYTLQDRTRLRIEILISCEDNWFGTSCEGFCKAQDTNEGHYDCNKFSGEISCKPGWGGYSCNVNIDECASNPCFSTGGTCIDGINGFRCECFPGFKGRLCEPETCESQPCQNGATCIAKLTEYECSCLNGYTGIHCEIDIDECASSPCANGGQCVDNVNRYDCQCPEGFMGENCEEERDECDSAPCHNDGQCEDQPGGYVCVCSPGFAGDVCEINIDECESSPCQNGGECEDAVAGYICTCPQGYYSKDCELSVDECASDPCQNGAACIDQHNGYKCGCLSGFTGTHCEEDINECDSSPCVHGSCEDKVDGYTCVCQPGFGGVNCDGEKDECESNPCQNGGRCIDKFNEYRCKCLKGYAGKNCQREIQECASNPCLNGGTCNEGIGGYVCVCVKGYSGTHCELEANECRSNPCKNGADCIDKEGGYQCQCRQGFQGLDCAINVNECDSDPCQNGGECNDGIAGYSCQCTNGYLGENCEQEIDECDSHPCRNGATCLDGHGEYQCQCIPGFAGTQCEIDILECASNPCMHGGQCIEGIDGYNCACPAGFSGRHCGINLNECDSDPCMNGAICVDGEGKFTCVCSPGFEGILCETNIDECASEPCQNGGRCKDRVTGYRCKCEAGYEGKHCEKEIDECDSNPCQNSASCQDEINGFTCICSVGYEGATCEIETNECDSSPCQNGGTCTDQHGGYTCMCTPGYRGDICEENIDECKGQPCQNGATCEDGVNQYVCKCVHGFTGSTCGEDVIDCKPGICQHGGTCIDGLNDYECHCAPGFTGDQCETNIDECKSDPCLNGASCTDGLNGYSCRCPLGFEGERCETETDKCVSGPCLNGGDCSNVEGGFRCACMPGFTGDTCEEDIDECNSSPCEYGTCADEVDGFVCICDAGFAGELCEINVDECAELPCKNGATCEDGVSSFRCQCAPGYEGAFCEMEIDECSSNPCENGAKCIDSLTNFTCVCLEGFRGDLCEEEVTSCTENQCQNGAECVVQEEDYACVCQPGFSGPMCDVEIIYCPLQLCRNGGTCLQLSGTYACICAEGWTGYDCSEDLNRPSHTLQVELVRYNNPGAFTSEESCCDTEKVDHKCPLNQCDQYFYLCADDYDGTENPTKCKGGSLTTGVTSDSEDIKFSNDINGTANPVTFSFKNAWTGGAMMKILVKDQDDPEAVGEDVDFLVSRFKLPVATIEKEALAYGVIAQGRTRLEMKVKAFCNEDFFGPDCSTFCHAQQTTSGYYTCNDRGEKICLLGWYGPNCQMNTDECEKGVCKNGGTCVDHIMGYSCQCVPGFQGDNCEEGEPLNYCDESPCENGATCEELESGFNCYCTGMWAGNRCNIPLAELQLPTDRYAIKVRLVSYENSEGISNGTCCDTPKKQTDCPIDCDHFFIVCLQHDNMVNANNRCLGERRKTGTIWNRNTLNFSENIGGVENPLVFPLNTAEQTDFLLKVSVWDRDPQDEHDLVEHLTTTVNVVNGAFGQNDEPINVSLVGKTRMEIEVTTTCNDHWYGEKCDVMCYPRSDDVDGHYFCAEETGEKICHEGYEGVDCLDNVDDCASLPCQNGQCEDGIASFTCLCDQDFTGTLCDHRISSCGPNLCRNGGKCIEMSPGYRCECVDGWKGETCQENEFVVMVELKTEPPFTTERPLTYEELVQIVKKLREDTDAQQEEIEDLKIRQTEGKQPFSVYTSNFKTQLDEYLKGRFVCNPFLSEDDTDLQIKSDEYLVGQDDEHGQKRTVIISYSLSQFRKWRAQVKRKLISSGPPDVEGLELAGLQQHLFQEVQATSLDKKSQEKQQKLTIVLRSFAHENKLFGTDDTQQGWKCGDWEFWDYFRHYFVRAEKDKRPNKWGIFSQREQTRIDDYNSKQTSGSAEPGTL